MSSSITVTLDMNIPAILEVVGVDNMNFNAYEMRGTTLIVKDVPQEALDQALANYDPACEAYPKRAGAYPSIPYQLDYIYHNGIEKWKADMILPVKEKYPKGAN